MKPSELTAKLLSTLKSLEEGKLLFDWEYLGKTDIAYGTPTGPWDPKRFPGFRFRKNTNDFILRSIEYVVDKRKFNLIVVESISNKGQLANLSLNEKNKFQEVGGTNFLYENFAMTVGRGAKPRNDVKSKFSKLGFNESGLITSFKDNLDPLKVINDVLNWGIIREQVKKQFQNEATAISESEVSHEAYKILEKEHAVDYRGPLNEILYGPSGTGKTFRTIDKAVQIASPGNYKESHVSNKKEYDRLVKEGQVVFCTFHQSMSYEDFVEGIKPQVKGDKVTYEVKNGIFKEIVKKARESFDSSLKKDTSFEAAFQRLKEEWEESETGELEIKMKQKSFWITDITERHIAFRKASGGTAHDLVISSLKDIYKGERKFYSGLGIYYDPLVERLKSYKIESKQTPLKNFVLIIDEINRGNVSAIFGELITLLEPDKRIGAPNELALELPYTKGGERFSMPPNLYIVGTMNTADRSVEALDAALRRRFSFEAMYPKSELLSPLAAIWRFWNAHVDAYWGSIEKYKAFEGDMWKLLGLTFNAGSEKAYVKYGDDEENEFTWEEFQETVDPLITFSEDGVDLERISNIINQRITYLKDEDHQIGHSYFMNVFSVEDLRETFKKNIIPLLKEYFYNDHGKIRLILGDDFMEPLQSPGFAVKDVDIDERERYVLKAIDEDFDIVKALKNTLASR